MPACAVLHDPGRVCFDDQWPIKDMAGGQRTLVVGSFLRSIVSSNGDGESGALYCFCHAFSIWPAKVRGRYLLH